MEIYFANLLKEKNKTVSKWNKLHTENRLGNFFVFHPSTIRILPEINLFILISDPCNHMKRGGEHTYSK